MWTLMLYALYVKLCSVVYQLFCTYSLCNLFLLSVAFHATITVFLVLHTSKFLCVLHYM